MSGKPTVSTTPAAPAPDRYVLRRGEAGAERLRLLSAVKAPSTLALLRRSGLRRGMRVLDVGSGIGEVTMAIARRVGPTGSATGIDLDPDFVERARAAAARRGSRATFRVGDVRSLGDEPGYDLVFSRYLLSHLAEPAAALARLVAVLVPGGVLAVEDIDFTGHVCYPPSAAFERYVELYQAVVRANGGDPVLGPRLGTLLTEAGLAGVQVAIAQPAFTDGPGKRLAAVTLAHIRDGVVAAGIASADQVDATVAELEDYAAEASTMLTLSRTFQAWGQRPADPDGRRPDPQPDPSTG
jgi:SAM-dependent methyltransferase